MSAAAQRVGELVARIEARFAASDVPVYVRVRDGRREVGIDRMGSRGVLWREVPFISSELLARGFGVRFDDEVPF